MPSVSRSVGSTRLIKSFDFIALGSATTNHNLGIFANLSSAWYLVTVTRNSDLAEETFQLAVGKLLTGQPTDQLYSRLGERIDYTFKVRKVAADLVFEVVNSDASDISINYIRIRK